MYILSGIPEALQLNSSIIAVIIVFFVYHFILKLFFYSPLEKILKKRAALTVEKFEKCEALSKKYEEMVEKYENSLRDARLRGTKLIEEVRKRAVDEKNKRLNEVLKDSKKMFESHKMEILKSIEEGKRFLEKESQKLAEEIVSKFLVGSKK